MDTADRRASWARELLGWILTGLLAGIAGIACTWVLHGVQWLAFGQYHGDVVHGVAAAPPWRRVVALSIAGAGVGCAWWALRRLGPLPTPTSAALSTEAPELPWWRTAADALIQLVAVGAGASIGREGAPRQLAAAAAVHLSRFLGLSAERTRTLLCVGAGAGLGAVYAVPFAAAVFVWEVLRRARRPAEAVGTVLICLLAAAVAWPVTGPAPQLRFAPPGTGSPLFSIVPLAAIVAVLGAAVGATLTRCVTWATVHRPEASWRLPTTMTIGFAIIGGVALFRPEVAGNGKAILETLVSAQPPAVGVLAAILALKFVLTILTLRVGAVGGLLMPSASLGAALGAGAATVTGLGAADAALCAVVGAVAVLAVTQRAPFFATVFVLELTYPSIAIALLTLGAAVVAGGAYALARRPLNAWVKPRS